MSALRGVQGELRRMGASDLRLGLDVRLRGDGLPYAQDAERNVGDPGAVVYCTHRGRKLAFTCDTYTDRTSNLRAIGLTLAAKRALRRYGATDEAAEYQGYEALPPRGGTTGAAPKRPAHEVLSVHPESPPEVIRAAFNALAKCLHPDKVGGDTQRFQEIVAARDELLTKHKEVTPRG